MKHKIACIAAALFVALAPAAPGFVTMKQPQVFLIRATTYHQPLIYNYTAQGIWVGSVQYPADSWVSAETFFDQWVELFLYDYGQGRFVESFVWNNFRR